MRGRRTLPTRNIGVPITLNTMQWNVIRSNDNHRLHKEAYWFPIACELGFVTSRKEEEWMDDQTCSSDLTYLGAIPSAMENVLNGYCHKASSNVAKEMKERCQQQCKSLKKHWRRVEIFARARSTIVQRSISAQLQSYQKSLGKIEDDVEGEYQQGGGDSDEDIEEAPVDPNIVECLEKGPRTGT